MCRSSYHHYRYEDRRSATRRTVSDPVPSPGTRQCRTQTATASIELLKQHTADGRLTLEEFEARVDETLAARTGSDLRMVLRDSPVPDRGRPRPPSRPSVAGSALGFPVIVLGVVLFWVVVGHLLLWPLSVAGFLWYRVGAGRHRRARWDYAPARPHRGRGHHDVFSPRRQARSRASHGHGEQSLDRVPPTAGTTPTLRAPRASNGSR